MTAQFDHEHLDVYRLALEFVGWASELMTELQSLAAARGGRIGEVFDPLDRASLSSLFNTAEGNGKRATRLRGRFFDDARGSATECAACLDALVAKHACDGGRIEHGKQLLLRIAAMLTRLVARFAPVTMAREEAGEYRARPADRKRPGQIESSGGTEKRGRVRARGRTKSAAGGAGR